MPENCIFCDFGKNKRGPLWGGNLWEGDYFYARLDSFPVSPGHALIIPYWHVVDLFELGEIEWADLRLSIACVMAVLARTNLKHAYNKMLENPLSDTQAEFCKEALNHPRINTTPDAYNHGVNDGREAGRTVDHLHWHIIPRFIGDMKDPRGGVRYVIPEKGNYKIPR